MYTWVWDQWFPILVSTEITCRLLKTLMPGDSCDCSGMELGSWTFYTSQPVLICSEGSRPLPRKVISDSSVFLSQLEKLECALWKEEAILAKAWAWTCIDWTPTVPAQKPACPGGKCQEAVWVGGLSSISGPKKPTPLLALAVRMAKTLLGNEATITFGHLEDDNWPMPGAANGQSNWSTNSPSGPAYRPGFSALPGCSVMRQATLFPGFIS